MSQSGRDLKRTEEFLPVSFAQERLWFLWQLEPDSPAYARPLVLRLEGPLDVPALENALNEVRRRHEVLRAVFSSVEGTLRQTIRAWEPWSLAVRDISEPDEVEQLTREAAQEPFDLTNGPLMRATLLRYSDQENFLLLVFHHIAFDAWSGKQLAAELAQWYCRITPPPLALQYADYAASQRQCSWEPDLAYWKEQLRDELPVLELPTAKPRLGARSYLGESVAMEFPADLVNALKQLGRQERTTLFTVFLAAFKTLLWRYTGEPDVIVGCPIAGRRQVETEPLLGCFINMLALRSKVKGEASFIDFLREVRSEALNAFQHQNVPFEKVIEAVNPPRAENRTPIFQTVLNFRNLPETAGSAGSIKFIPHHCPDGLAQFDLTLDLTEAGGPVLGRWIYDCEILEREDVERLANHFRTLLESIIASPKEPLTKLRLLPESERRQLLVEWNPTAIEYPKNKCVHELFSAQAERMPEATAVIFEGQSLSYRELNEQANQLAHYLRSFGVKPDTLVGICCDRSAEMIVDVLGTLKAGGAYVPIDLSYPMERLLFMIQDTGVKVLLARKKPPKEFAAIPGLTIVDPCKSFGCPKENCTPGGSAENIAYVMFTSGSTGQPKGVPILHRGVVRLVFGQDYAVFGSGERILQFSTMAFDAATFELWAPLLHGGTCIVAPEQSLTALEELIREQKPTCVFLTAGLFNQVIDTQPAMLSSVRHVMTGGEALSATHITRALALLPSVRFTNCYGPTESTEIATTYLIPQDRQLAGKSVPIGKPIAHTSCYLLDEEFNPVPIGVPGELFIGGDGLSPGYVNRPALTAARFVPNPFGPGKLYRTGDRCRWLADGNIEFLGRLDQQVKIRGFRVELGEVEAALRRIPGIQEAVVIARARTTSSLAAYLVVPSGTELSSAKLREELARWLPDYMIPATFTMVKELPLNRNGKVDRPALEKMEGKPLAGTSQPVHPANATQAQLASLWAEVLEVGSVGVRDNFFELGGHSLLAMKLTWEVQKHFGKTLPLNALFAAPTIEQFSRLLENKSTGVMPATTLRGRGTGAPLFHIPGLGGYEFLPEPVARRVGTVRRFYDGLQFAGLDGKQPPLTRIEDMASHLLAQIRWVCPRGPYCLSGYSFGGVMAVEIARQLQAQGQEVELLFLWDSYCPNGTYARRSVWEAMNAVRKRLVSMDQKEWLPFLRNMIGAKLALRRERWQQWWQWRCRFMRRPGPEIANLQVVRAIQAAKRHYRPGPYAGKVVLFQAEDQEFTRLFKKPDPLNGWCGTLLGEVKTLVIPGDHNSAMVEPAVSVFAEKMRECLK